MIHSFCTVHPFGGDRGLLNHPQYQPQKKIHCIFDTLSVPNCTFLHEVRNALNHHVLLCARVFDRRTEVVSLFPFFSGCKKNWLVVSTPLKNMSQNRNLRQVGVKIRKYLTPPARKARGVPKEPTSFPVLC